MTNRFFSFGIYKNSLRQLRLAGIFLTALTSVLAAYPLVMTLLDAYPGYSSYTTLVWPIALTPFVAAPILTLLPLQFQSHRADSDFYHALPVTKRTLVGSCFAASATWCATVVIVPTLLLLLLSSFRISQKFLPTDAWYLFLQCGSALVASLFVMTVVILAAALCGKTFNTVCTAAVLIAAPRLIAYTVSGLLLDRCVVLPPDSGRALLDGLSQNLLYSNNTDPSVWIATAIKILLIGALAFWAISKRPSEIAERAALSPILHVVFRTLLTLLFCLVPVSMLLETGFRTSATIYTAVLYYILALAVYYLYEVLTTRSAKSLWKATLWLPLVIALNVLMIGGVSLGSQLITNTCPTAEEIDSVSLSRLVYRLNDDGYLNDTGYGYRSGTEYNYLGYENVFYSVTRRYAESRGPQVQLEDEESRRIVSEALARYIESVGQPTSSIYYSDIVALEALVGDRGIVYLADVQIHDGWFTHDRRIALTEEELKALVKKIDKQAKLPTMMDSIFTFDRYEGCTHYSEETGLDGGTVEIGFDETDPRSYFHILDKEGTMWISTEHLAKAGVVYSGSGNNEVTAAVYITLNEDGTALLHEATLKNQSQPLYICYGDNVLYAPVINEPITNGEVLIHGSFSTLQDAQGFAELLNSQIERE